MSCLKATPLTLLRVALSKRSGRRTTPADWPRWHRKVIVVPANPGMILKSDSRIVSWTRRGCSNQIVSRAPSTTRASSVARRPTVPARHVNLLIHRALIVSVLANNALVNNVRCNCAQRTCYGRRSALAGKPGMFRAGSHQSRRTRCLPAVAGAAWADPSAVSSNAGAVGQRQIRRGATVGQGHSRTAADGFGHPLADAQTPAEA